LQHYGIFDFFVFIAAVYVFVFFRSSVLGRRICLTDLMLFFDRSPPTPTRALHDGTNLAGLGVCLTPSSSLFYDFPAVGPPLCLGWRAFFPGARDVFFRRRISRPDITRSFFSLAGDPLRGLPFPSMVTTAFEAAFVSSHDAAE